MQKATGIADNQTLSQSDRFKEAARELEADPDEKRWEERLRTVVKQKPKPVSETEPSSE